MNRTRQSSQKPNSATKRADASNEGQPPPAAVPLHPFMQLQQALGNQAVLRRMQAGLDHGSIHGMHQVQPIVGNHGVARRLQTKLKVNTPGDQYEQEADRVAEHVVRMPEPSATAAPRVSASVSALQRKCSCGGSASECAKCQEEREQTLHRSASATAAAQYAPPIVRDVLDAPGEPLDAATRAFFEPRFGKDFAEVRLHRDSRAGQSARAVNAQAFTVGNHVAFAQGTYNPTTEGGRQLLAHELTHVVQQRGTGKNPVGTGLLSGGHGSLGHTSVRQVGLQRQSQPIPTTDDPLPKSLQSLSDQDRQSFRGFIVKGLVPLPTAPGTRLTGEREHDTAVLTEYFLCANAWSASAILAGGIDPDPLFCTYSEVTRSRPIFSRHKKAVIEPEYDKTPPELLQLLRTRQDLFKAIDEDLIFIGNKKASLDDKDPNQRQAARLFSSFKTQLTEGLPVTDAQGKPVSPTPELLSAIKTLTDAVRSRKTGSSSTKIDFAIISLLRPRDDDKSPHKQGRAVDISIYAGNHIDMFHPEEALDGIAQLIDDLPPGKYWLGVPRHPRRDQLFGCSDFFSRLFQPHLSRLYQPSLFAPGCPHHPPNIRQEILKTRNMFFPWYFTPGNTYGVDKMEAPDAKLRLQEVLARKAPQVTVSFGPDALDHVHVQLE